MRKRFQLCFGVLLLFVVLSVFASISDAGCLTPGVFQNKTSQMMKMWADAKLFYVPAGKSSTSYNCDADSFGFVSVPCFVVRNGVTYYCGRGQWFGQNKNPGGNNAWGCWSTPYGVTIGWETYECKPEPPNGFIYCRKK